MSSCLHGVRVPAGGDATERRLRIAYLVHDYRRQYGHGRYVVELAERFRHDHEVHVFANTFDAAGSEGIHFHRVPTWRANALTTALTFMVPATLAVRGRFDIVHAQGLCGLRQNVVTAHIVQAAWYDALTRHAGRQSWRKRVFQALTSRLERRTFAARGTQVIAVSQRIADDLSEHYGCRQPMHVIHHGVDIELFHPRQRQTWRAEIRRKLGLGDEACVALYVGDLQKALPAALRALALTPGVHLVAVSRSRPAPYERLIDELGVADRVHLEPVSGHIERYYAAADLFVFPSFYDSFGLVVTEAMASGLPVVCSSAAGAAEVIDDGVDGLLVTEPWQPAQLAGAIQTLAHDAGLRGRLGAAARGKVEQHTWDRTARLTMAVYREVAGA